MDVQPVFYPAAALGWADWTPLPSLGASPMSVLRIQTTTPSRSRQSASLPALLAALVPSLASAVLLLLVFLLIKRPLRRIYSPRTYIDVIPDKDRTPISSLKRFEWFRTVRQLDDKFVLEHSSLDAYLYLRFLRTVIFICFVGVCITWPVLLPVNATGGGGASQLDRLGFGNVVYSNHLYAHAIIAWLFFGFVMFVVARERIWLVGLRQAWYLSRTNASRLSSRTVLYLDPQDEASADDHVQSTFGSDARSQWVITKTKHLDDAVKSRDSKAEKLEAAEVAFLRQASKKLAKKGADTAADADLESARPRERQYYVARNASDLIHHLRSGVKEAIQKVEDERELYTVADGAGGHTSRCAVFVEYADQQAAQRAYRGESVLLHIPVAQDLAIQSRLIGVVPNEVIWRNLAMPQVERLSKKTVANVLVTALIVFWSIPIAFVATISNVNYLASLEGLQWLRDLPRPVLSVLTGLLPPVLTSLLATFVPNLMRKIAKASGEPTTVAAELQVQAWYYAFQIIQVFLVTSLSSSAIALIPAIINQPDHVPALLAENIPKSSNFYLTYFILQGLANSVTNIMNWNDLLGYIWFSLFAYKTPRDKYKRYIKLKNIAWGKVYPKFTNFLIIALVYSCISPLVLGFATIGLSLFYCSYKYNLLFVVKPKIESKGKCYTRALQQILAGVYIGELCLVGLFGLRQATGPSVLTLILFCGTIAYHILMNHRLKPLEDHFPDNLISDDGKDPEEQSLQTSVEEGSTQEGQEPREDSRIQQVGREVHIPQAVLDPVARFFEPHVYASREAMTEFLKRTAAETDPLPEYTDDELKDAYKNPSLKSKTPLIWLPKDEYGLSKKEIESLAAEDGLEATDEGAWVDRRGQVDFDSENLRALPVWIETPPY